MRLRVIMFCVFVYNEKAVRMVFDGRRTHETATVVRVVWRPWHERTAAAEYPPLWHKPFIVSAQRYCCYGAKLIALAL